MADTEQKLDNVTAYRATRDRQVEALAVEIGRYGDRLLPGAAKVIAQRNRDLAAQPADKRAERVASLIESPLWAKWLNPEFVPPRLENGAELSPLRAALARQLDRLAPSTDLDVLVEHLATRVVGKSGPQIAAFVARWMDSREADDFKSGIVVRPAEDALVNRIVAHFGDAIGHQGARRLAVERPELGRMGEPQLIATVATALSSAVVAQRYGAGPIPPDDPRLTGRPRDGHAGSERRPEPARDGSGRFQPAKPARERPAF